MLSSGSDFAGAARTIPRRDAFRVTDIALPQVLTVEPDGRTRLLDAETDLFPSVNWGHLDLAALGSRLRKDARPPDSQLVRLRAGEHGVETDSAVTIASKAPFDAAYAVRAIADIVPNAFVGWAIVNDLLERLRSKGWEDAGLGRLAAFITDELRKTLTDERERQAAALFKAGLGDGTIRYALRGDDRDWIAPATIRTSAPATAAQLTSATGKTLDRSLFLHVFAGDLNSEEQRFAVRLDGDAAVRWWHRNGTDRESYAVRGWRRGNVYPDFLFATIREGGRDRIVAIETKGEQLAGNLDTKYKSELLETLTGAFRVVSGSGMVGRAAINLSAAVVLFGELDARLPALIQGDPASAGAKETGQN